MVLQSLLLNMNMAGLPLATASNLGYHSVLIGLPDTGTQPYLAGQFHGREDSLLMSPTTSVLIDDSISMGLPANSVLRFDPSDLIGDSEVLSPSLDRARLSPLQDTSGRGRSLSIGMWPILLLTALIFCGCADSGSENQEAGMSNGWLWGSIALNVLMGAGIAFALYKIKTRGEEITKKQDRIGELEKKEEELSRNLEDITNSLSEMQRVVDGLSTAESKRDQIEELEQRIVELEPFMRRFDDLDGRVTLGREQKAQLDALKVKYNDIQEGLQAEKAALDQEKTDLEGERQGLLDDIDVVVDRQRRVDKIKADNPRLEEDKERLRVELAALLREVAKRDSLKLKIEQTNKENPDLEDEIKRYQVDLESLEEAVRQFTYLKHTYDELLEEYPGISGQMSQLEGMLSELKAKIQRRADLQTELSHLERENPEIEQEVEVLDEEAWQLREKHEELKQELSRVDGEVAGLIDEVGELEGRLREEQTKKGSLTRRRHRLEGEIAEAKKNIEILTREIKGDGDELGLEDQRNAFNDELRLLKTERDSLNLNLQQLRDEIFQREKAIARIKEDISQKEARKAELEKQKIEYGNKNETIQWGINQVNEGIRQLVQRHEELKKELDQRDIVKQEIEGQIAKAEDDLKALLEESEGLSQTLNEKWAELGKEEEMRDTLLDEHGQLDESIASVRTQIVEVEDQAAEHLRLIAEHEQKTQELAKLKAKHSEEELAKDIKRVDAEIVKIQKQIDELAKLELEREQLIQENTGLAEKVNKVRESIREIREGIRRNEARLAELNKEKGEVSQSHVRLRKDIESAEDKRVQLAEEVAQAEARLQQAQAEVDDYRGRLERIRTEGSQLAGTEEDAGEVEVAELDLEDIEVHEDEDQAPVPSDTYEQEFFGLLQQVIRFRTTRDEILKEQSTLSEDSPRYQELMSTDNELTPTIAALFVQLITMKQDYGTVQFIWEQGANIRVIVHIKAESGEEPLLLSEDQQGIVAQALEESVERLRRYNLPTQYAEELWTKFHEQQIETRRQRRLRDLDREIPEMIKEKKMPLVAAFSLEKAILVGHQGGLEFKALRDDQGKWQVVVCFGMAEYTFDPSDTAEIEFALRRSFNFIPETDHQSLKELLDKFDAAVTEAQDHKPVILKGPVTDVFQPKVLTEQVLDGAAQISMATTQGIGYAKVNEDGVYVNEDGVGYVYDPDGSLHLIVVDGMGGHAAGDRAADLALTYFARAMANHKDPVVGLEAANTTIRSFNQQNNANSGAAAITASILKPQQAGESHVIKLHWMGDARAYYFRQNEWIYRTVDEGYADMFVQAGQDYEEGGRGRSLARASFEYAHAISNALGMNKTASIRNTSEGELPDRSSKTGSKPASDYRDGIMLEMGDLILLGSDGFHENFTTEEIFELIRNCGTAKDIVKTLTHEAHMRMQAVKTMKKGERKAYVFNGRTLYLEKTKKSSGELYTEMEGGEHVGHIKCDNFSLIAYLHRPLAA